MRRGITGGARPAALLVTFLTVAGCTGSTPHPGSASATTSAAGSAEPTAVPAQWQITHPGPEHATEGYADHGSVHPGERVRLFVSTTAPSFTATAFWIGNYPPTGGARIWTSAPQPGHRQPAAQIEQPRHTVARGSPRSPSTPPAGRPGST